MASLVAQRVKCLSARNAGDLGSVPGLERSPTQEKEMATQSSILAWKIPWTEEPGGLQSMGLQTVRPDLATEHDLFTMHCPLQDTFQALPLNSLGIAHLPIGLLP